MTIRAVENEGTTEKRDDAGFGPDAVPCPNSTAPSGAPEMIAPCAQLTDADPWAVSHPFTQAAAWQRVHAADHATGSRDFGRGFMHAANVLTDAAEQAS